MSASEWYSACPNIQITNCSKIMIFQQISVNKVEVKEKYILLKFKQIFIF